MTNFPSRTKINQLADVMASARLALCGIRAIAEVLQKDLLDQDTFEGYEPFSLSAREGLAIAVDVLSENAYEEIESSGYYPYTDKRTELNLVKNSAAGASS